MTKTVESKLKVTLIDGVSGPAKKAGGALETLYKKSFASRAMGGLGAYFARDAKRIAGALGEFRDSMYGPAGLAAALAGHELFDAQVSYEKAMNRIKATSRSSAEELRELRDLINDLAIKYPKKRAEIAEGALQLFKSGKNVHEVLGALEPTLQASLATETTIGHAGETLTDIVFGMGLRATNAKEAMEAFTQVANTAVVASNAFNQNYELFVSGMAKAAPIARATGMTLRDVATVVGVLADENFKGEQGGTAFASSVLRLGNQTKKAKAELASAGISLDKFVKTTEKLEGMEGRGHILADVLAEDLGVDAADLVPAFDKILKDPKLNESGTLLGRELQKAIVAGLGMDANSPNVEKAREAVTTFLRGSMSRMDVIGILHELAAKDADKNLALMGELFGKNHAPKMMALINAVRQGLYDQRNKFIGEHENGAAEQYAKTLQEGLPGAISRLSSAWDHMGEVLFVNSGLIDHFVGAFDRLRATLAALRDASPAALTALGYGLTGLLAGGALAIGIDGIRIALRGLRLGLVLVTGPLGVVRAALAAIAYFKWDEITKGLGEFSSGFSSGFWSNLKPGDDVVAAWHNLTAAVRDATGITLDLTTWKELGSTLGGVVAQGVHLLASAFRHVCDTISEAIALAKSAASAFSNIHMPSIWGGSSSAPVAGARAEGGPVTGGKSYLVGERGPELFTPGSSGAIIPHGSKGAGTTINAPITVHVAGNADIADLEFRIRRALSDVARQALRGAQADVGLLWNGP